ncbi:hypothetical protein B0H19DRAFT_583304 [Mycena capillaripes]|nr:hypothetical protein B0H19DRAFT_583304 [Mycena capillaripes]
MGCWAGIIGTGVPEYAGGAADQWRSLAVLCGRGDMGEGPGVTTYLGCRPVGMGSGYTGRRRRACGRGKWLGRLGEEALHGV